jgi:hypothetical protein
MMALALISRVGSLDVESRYAQRQQDMNVQNLLESR